MQHIKILIILINLGILLFKIQQTDQEQVPLSIIVGILVWVMNIRFLIVLMGIMVCNLQLEEVKQILNYQLEEWKVITGQDGKD